MTTETTVLNPLSESVSAEAFRTGGGNLHAVAEMMEIKAAPLRNLAPAVREARRKRDEAEQALADADQELAQQNAIRREVAILAAEVADKTRKLSNDKTRLATAEADIANFPSDFEARHMNEAQHGWQIILHRVYSEVISEKLVAVYPAAIEKAESELEALQAKLAELRKKYSL